MKSARFTALLLALGMFSQYWASPIIDSNLKNYLLGKSDASITVIAKFRDQRERGKLASRTGVQSQKMANSLASQRRFFQEFGMMRKGQIEEITSLWINNSIILRASVSLIRDLLNRDDIAVLALDQEIRLVEPVLVVEEVHLESSDATYGLRQIRAPKVWEELGITGSGVRMGVLDTGYASHPDLEGKIIAARDFISGKPDNQPNDARGHGTHVLGTIGGGNTSGMAIGVAPDVRFLVGKIFDDKGYTTVSVALRAMQWMADPDSNPNTVDHPRIVSNSWGGKMKDRVVQLLFRSAVQSWREIGIVPVFAAGNSGPELYSVEFPGAYPESLAVGAVNSQDQIARFSSRGPVNFMGKTIIKPDVSAPGVEVFSADQNGGYARMSGTSMATPHVAGVVALMLQANPWLGPETISRVLRETSEDLGDTGKDPEFGAGRIDAYRAVSRVLEFGQVWIHVESGGQIATVEVGSRMELVQTNEHGDVYFSMAPGAYPLRVNSFGYQTRNLTLEVQDEGTTNLDIRLDSAPWTQLSLKIVDAGGQPLEADVSFPGTPLVPRTARSGALSLEVPLGELSVLVELENYFSREISAKILKETALEVRLLQDAPVVLVDKDGNPEILKLYRSALDEWEVEYNVLSSGSDIQFKDLQGHKTVIWFTGDRDSDTISKLERGMLEFHLRNGGGLILTGQGIGNDLGSTRFYKDVLGVAFKGDKRFFRVLRDYRGTKFKLNGKDSAGNQKRPDKLESLVEKPFDLFTYRTGDVAGIYNDVGFGRVVYLGFGLEGVSGKKVRSWLLERMLDMV
ncbi:S8 family serine peptidase, partial [bacterium]|nr:S8 family serine peptidase [bacterium]